MRRIKDKFSYSELRLWESSPRSYWNQYGLGDEPHDNEFMAKGRELMDYLQFGFCDDNDPLLPKVASQIDTLDIIEEVVTIKDPQLLSRLDYTNIGYDVIGEVKSGKVPWEQEDVDECDQLLFYSTVVWVKTGKIPACVLNWAQTEENDAGELLYTGNVYTFHTQFKKAKINSMIKRIKKALADIEAYVFTEVEVSSDLVAAWLKVKADYDEAKGTMDILKNEIDNVLVNSGERYGVCNQGTFTVATTKTGAKSIRFKLNKTI